MNVTLVQNPEHDIHGIIAARISRGSEVKEFRNAAAVP